MTFVKSLMLAVIITLLLTYLLGASILNWLDIDIIMHNQVVESMQAISISVVITVILVVLLLALVFSIFGLMMFVAMLGAGAVFMLSLSFLWPVFLIMLVVWLVSDKPAKRCHR